MIKRLSKCVREYKIYALLTPLFVIGEVIFECLIPYNMTKMLDNGIGANNLSVVYFTGTLMIIMSFASLFCGIMAGCLASKASTGFAKNLRKDMYENIQKYSFKNLDHFHTATLVTRLTTDITYVQMSFQMIIRLVVRAPFMIIISAVMACLTNKSMSIIFFVLIPSLAITLFVLMSRAFKPFSKMFKCYDVLNRDVEENLHAIRVVKSFVKEEDESKKIFNDTAELRKNASKAEHILAWNTPIIQFAVYVCLILISFLSAYSIVHNTNLGMTIGNLTSFISYTMQILMSLMMISQVFVIIVMSKTAAGRIIEVLDEKSDIVNPENPIFEVPNGDIEFKNVSFKYDENAPIYNLTDVNLSIKSGEVIGVIGGTGSSKTSFVSLIPRLYDTNVGEVIVGNHNVKDYDLNTLRTNVAVVLQKNVLFSGSIKDNLRWGNKDATDEEMIKVLKQSCAYDFVMSFPKGLDHDLGQGGVNVSGGQKQRLCIARALLKNPKILILDDSTSAVDTKTDKKIREELKNTLPSVTKIIIAQRISSVEDADKIIVLDDGKIIAFDTHENLLKTCSIYKEINDLQKKGGNDDEN